MLLVGLSLVLISAPLMSCSGHTDASVTNYSVQVVPASVALLPGATQHFACVVSGAINTACSYRVGEMSGGTITANGLYTAPAVAGTFHVIVTSPADPTAPVTATVSVQANPEDAGPQTPAHSMLAQATPGRSMRGHTTLAQATPGRSMRGHTTLAQATPGQAMRGHTTLAQATPGQAMRALRSPLSSARRPLKQGLAVRFNSAPVTGYSSTSVTWTLQEGALAGTLTDAGLYTAPSSSGVFHVTAASVADSMLSATAPVTVSAPQGTPPVLVPGVWSNLTPPGVNLSLADAHFGTTVFDLDPSNPYVIYLCIDQQGLWKTSDGGSTWTRLGDPPK